MDFHSPAGCVLACRGGIDTVFQWACTCGDLVGIGMPAKRRREEKKTHVNIHSECEMNVKSKYYSMIFSKFVA